MSLELKIEKLTLAINALNENMTKVLNVPAATHANEVLEPEQPEVVIKEEPEQPEVVIKDEPAEEQAPWLTHKDLQDFMLSFVRKDMTRKPKIKKLLSEYSASKVSDLKAEQLVKFKAKLELL